MIHEKCLEKCQTSIEAKNINIYSSSTVRICLWAGRHTRFVSRGLFSLPGLCVDLFFLGLLETGHKLLLFLFLSILSALVSSYSYSPNVVESSVILLEVGL